MIVPEPPIPQELIDSLAPKELPSYRALRYSGDGMGVALEQFAPADRQLIARLYGAIAELLELLRVARDDPEHNPAAVAARCAGSGWAQLLREVRDLTLPAEAEEDPHARQAIHDLKGGALQALAVYIQLAGLGMVRTADLSRMFFLARDQLKIMRNCVRDLDPEGAVRDSTTRLHSADLLVEKWSSSEHRLGERPVLVQVHPAFTGDIAERCLEFAALDRVIYNLVNNATRHSADGVVDLWMVPAGDASLRIAVINAVTAEQRRSVEARFPQGPGQLFAGGFSTTGSGLGMRICADFVCNAYGVPSVEQALIEGYLGATFVGQRFVAWVHWPVTGD